MEIVRSGNYPRGILRVGFILVELSGELPRTVVQEELHGGNFPGGNFSDGVVKI